MRKLFAVLLSSLLWLGLTPAVSAATTTTTTATTQSTHLVPCRESVAFNERLQSAPQTYYFEEPYQAYAANLLCGADGLPHLQLRLDKAIDVVIPFALFFYVAGFIGWSGRAYLLKSNRATKPEDPEIFINVPLAIASFIQGLLWPLLALKELGSGELTAPESELYVSPR